MSPLPFQEQGSKGWQHLTTQQGCAHVQKAGAGSHFTWSGSEDLFLQDGPHCTQYQISTCSASRAPRGKRHGLGCVLSTTNSSTMSFEGVGNSPALVYCAPKCQSLIYISNSISILNQHLSSFQVQKAKITVSKYSFCNLTLNYVITVYK